MAMNPMDILSLKKDFDTFQYNHPKFIQFCQYVGMQGIHEGTVLECTVKTPDGQTMTSNIKITQDDLDLIEKLKGMR